MDDATIQDDDSKKEIDPALFEDADPEELDSDDNEILGEDIDPLRHKRKSVGDVLPVEHEGDTESLDALAEEEDEEEDGVYDDRDLL